MDTVHYTHLMASSQSWTSRFQSLDETITKSGKGRVVVVVARGWRRGMLTRWWTEEGHLRRKAMTGTERNEASEKPVWRERWEKREKDRDRVKHELKRE